jgi:Rhodanese-like domain
VGRECDGCKFGRRRGGYGGRKLIAVVYADMVGHSRLISLNAGTLRRLRTLRRALIDPAIREFGGKIVQTGGDSLLVAFDSIDGAVRCAVKVQQQVPVYAGDQQPDRRHPVPHYEAPTPTTVPGAQTVRTPDLVKLLEQRKPLVLDAVNWGQSIPGAIGLWGAGIGGRLSDEYQDRLGRKMKRLSHGNKGVPIVVMGFNSERYQGRNLALRLVALGYTNVYWYRGGREAWEVAGCQWPNSPCRFGRDHPLAARCRAPPGLGRMVKSFAAVVQG